MWRYRAPALPRQGSTFGQGGGAYVNCRPLISSCALRMSISGRAYFLVPVIPASEHAHGQFWPWGFFVFDDSSVPRGASSLASRDLIRCTSDNLRLAYVTMGIPDAKARLYAYTCMFVAAGSSFLVVSTSIGGAWFGSSLDSAVAADMTGGFVSGQSMPIDSAHTESASLAGAGTALPRLVSGPTKSRIRTNDEPPRKGGWRFVSCFQVELDHPIDASYDGVG